MLGLTSLRAARQRIRRSGPKTQAMGITLGAYYRRISTLYAARHPAAGGNRNGPQFVTPPEIASILPLHSRHGRPRLYIFRQPT